MKKITLLFLLGFFVISLSCAGLCADSPDNVVDMFYSSIEKGDIKTMFTFVTEEQRQKIVDTCSKIEKEQPLKDVTVLESIFIFAGMVQTGKMKSQFEDRKITVESSSDKNAKVHITYTANTQMEGEKSSEPGDDTFSLVKNNDKWLITDVTDNLSSGGG